MAKKIAAAKLARQEGNRRTSSISAPEDKAHLRRLGLDPCALKEALKSRASYLRRGFGPRGGLQSGLGGQAMKEDQYKDGIAASVWEAYIGEDRESRYKEWLVQTLRLHNCVMS